MAPFELTHLHALRNRGQCPTLPIFVADSWAWQQAIAALGALCVRVRNPADHNHDWRALRGLHCILLCRPAGDYADLGLAILGGEPSLFETFHFDKPHQPAERPGIPLLSRKVLGRRTDDYELLFQRDSMLNRVLRWA